MKHATGGKESYQRMPDAALNQANPISGTFYTILDTVLKARIRGIAIRSVWTVQPGPLVLRITIDGNVLLHSFAVPVTNAPYSPQDSIFDFNNAEAAQRLVAAFSASDYPPFPIEGKSIMIEMAITAGTVQSLVGRVKYSLLRP